ncbi:hypothetical protein H1C71_001987, partial [Ictidomys tridecemlineatus]
SSQSAEVHIKASFSFTVLGKLTLQGQHLRRGELHLPFLSSPCQLLPWSPFITYLKSVDISVKPNSRPEALFAHFFKVLYGIVCEKLVRGYPAPEMLVSSRPVAK